MTPAATAVRGTGHNAHLKRPSECLEGPNSSGAASWVVASHANTLIQILFPAADGDLGPMSRDGDLSFRAPWRARGAKESFGVSVKGHPKAFVCQAAPSSAGRSRH